MKHVDLVHLIDEQARLVGLALTEHVIAGDAETRAPPARRETAATA